MANSNSIEDLISEIKQLKPASASATGEPFSDFGPPASKEDIKALEDHCGYDLPPEFKQYLQIHDGQIRTTYEHKGKEYVTYIGAIPTLRRMLTCKQILNQSITLTDDVKRMRGDDESQYKTRGDWWHPRLLLFSEMDGGGTGIDPANGEIISWDHDGGPVTTIHASFAELLLSILEHMRNNPR